MFDVTLKLNKRAPEEEGSPGSLGSLGGSSGSGVLKSSTVVLRRDWQEFRALHLALTSLLSFKVARLFARSFVVLRSVAFVERVDRRPSSRFTQQPSLLPSPQPPQQSTHGDDGEAGGEGALGRLPPLPQYAGAETTDAEMAEQVREYLQRLLELPDVCASGPFLGLLNDHDGAGGAECSGLAPESAFDFCLQPCPVSSTYVARRAQHQEEVEVPARSTVLWRFSVGDGLDIQFSAVFTPGCSSGSGSEEAGTEAEAGDQPVGRKAKVLMEGRFPAAGAEEASVQGSFTAPVAGSCAFTWDNAYSRLRGKQVSIALQVVSPEAMQAAVEAAAELARASSRNRSLITARIRDGKAGGGQIEVEVTPVARPPAATKGDGAGADGHVEDAMDGLTLEEERLIASGRGGLGALLSSSAPSASLRKSASSASIHSLDGSSASSSATTDATAAAIAAATAAAATGEAGEEQTEPRRSSLGLIWGYLSRGKEEGGDGDQGGAGSQQQPPQLGGGDVEKVVAMVEKLEDELAHMTAKKEQAEAEAVIALAKQRRWSIEKERFERRMNEALVRCVGRMRCRSAQNRWID